MSRYVLTPLAVEDLREIARYTEKQWGAIQTESYGEELELALQQLSLAPEVGKKRDAIALGVRSFRVAQHVAFYLIRRNEIRILRILHPRRNANEAFEDSE
ncbi:MAG TPA: type II toxin-antitoxin system RelE/ParE family toxin [Steroidobacteraceae bacterium]|jgi:toxin ParE1/3/4|nr:type II toxin-antitoxin system RelE/ParE family toxin [Steroidobacteraceae bacterium]